LSSFNPPNPLGPLTKARSIDINALTDSIAAAFMVLPSEASLNNGSINFVTDIGMPSALVITSLGPNINSLSDGMSVVVRVANAASGPSTIAISAFPIKQIRSFDGSPIAAGDFVAGQLITLRYDSVKDWFQFNPSSSAAAIAAASQAADSASAAAASAIAAQGVQLTGTSATSVFIDTGSKVFTTQAGKQWPINVPIIAVNSFDPTKFMAGTVAAYSGTSLTIGVTSVGGLAETYTSWNISTAGVRGAPGTTASNTQFPVIPVAALNLDLSLGNYFTKTIAGNSTFTFSNVPAQGFSFTLRLTHTSGVITFPANVYPRDGVIPTLTPGKVHIFVLVTDDTGTIWHLGVNPNYAS